MTGHPQGPDHPSGVRTKSLGTKRVTEIRKKIAQSQLFRIAQTKTPKSTESFTMIRGLTESQVQPGTVTGIAVVVMPASTGTETVGNTAGIVQIASVAGMMFRPKVNKLTSLYAYVHVVADGYVCKCSAVLLQSCGTLCLLGSTKHYRKCVHVPHNYSAAQLLYWSTAGRVWVRLVW